MPGLGKLQRSKANKLQVGTHQVQQHLVKLPSKMLSTHTTAWCKSWSVVSTRAGQDKPGVQSCHILIGCRSAHRQTVPQQGNPCFTNLRCGQQSRQGVLKGCVRPPSGAPQSPPSGWSFPLLANQGCTPPLQQPACNKEKPLQRFDIVLSVVTSVRHSVNDEASAVCKSSVSSEHGHAAV